MADRRPTVAVRVPGDKSISHRALILAALARGESRLTGVLDAADTRSTAGALRALGVDLGRSPEGGVRVRGRGPEGLRAPAGALDCGNSGTTARLLLGVLAGCPLDAVLTGDASLRGRPMRRVTEPLARAGAAFRELGEADRLPVRVTGARPLAPIRWQSPQASAQVKSALLLAGLAGRAAVEVIEPGRSRDHTERMLRALGVAVTTEPIGPGVRVALEEGGAVRPLDLRIPGDASAAAHFAALGVLAGPLRVEAVCLNVTRTGALRVLERMGGRIVERPDEDRAGEPVGSVAAEPGALTAVEVGPAEVPGLIDEVPLLAAVAAMADGESRFPGLAELRVKESDRVAAVATCLRALGVEVEARPEELRVGGRARPLRGRVDAGGDHRIAMAFGILAAVPGNRIEVVGREAVGISFPGFWDEVERVSRELNAS